MGGGAMNHGNPQAAPNGVAHECAERARYFFGAVAGVVGAAVFPAAA
jgi:hypothetical protein